MAEILHQLIGSLSHYLPGFSTIPVSRISGPSTVPKMMGQLEGLNLRLQSMATFFRYLRGVPTFFLIHRNVFAGKLLSICLVGG